MAATCSSALRTAWATYSGQCSSTAPGQSSPSSRRRSSATTSLGDMSHLLHTITWSPMLRPNVFAFLLRRLGADPRP